jgi:hypothetical protein
VLIAAQNQKKHKDFLTLTLIMGEKFRDFLRKNLAKLDLFF